MSGKTARLLPLIVGLLGLTTTLFVWRLLENHERRQIAAIVSESSVNLQNSIETQLNNHARALERMAARWSVRGGTPQAEWTVDAKHYVADYNGYQAVEWVDQSGHIRWVMPEEGNKKAVNFDLNSENNRRTALEKARVERVTTLSRTVDLVQGGKGFLVFAPIYTNDNFGGFITGIFRVNKFVNLSKQQEKDYAVQLFENDQEFYRLGEPNAEANDLSASKTINLYDNSWVLRATPSAATVARLSSAAGEWALIIGIFLSGLLAWTVSLAQKARARALQATDANDGLENEIVQRIRVQKNLQEVSTLQKAVLDGANYMIIATDPQGTIISFNRAAEKNLGYTAEEIIGKTSPAIFHDPSEVVARAAELSEETKSVVEPGFEVFVLKARIEKVEEREWTYSRKDATKFPVSLSITALRDETGAITGFLGIADDITEKKRAAEEIRAAEERFKTFMNNSPAVSYLKDSEGKYVFMNKTMEHIFDIDVEKMRNKTDFDWLPEDTARAIRARDQIVLETGEPMEFMQIINSADGAARTWQTYKFPVYDSEGKPFVGVVAFDVTTQQESQNALRKSEHHNRDLIEKSPGLISTHTLDGVLLSVNPAAAHALGYEPEELIGKSLADFMPDDRKVLFGEFVKQIKQKKALTGTMRLINKKGEERVWSYTNTIYEEDGSPYVLGHAFDITESRRAENALRESEERVRNLLKFSPVGIVLTDAAGGVAFINERWSKMTGLTLEEAKGAGWANAVHPDDRERMLYEWTEKSQLAEETSYEFRFSRSDGEQTEVIARAIKQYDEKGEFSGHLATVADITEIKKLQTDLEIARDAALDSARMKAEFLANMSHEIRTPMNGVIGMTDILLTTDLDDEQREQAEIIKSSADGLLNIINDILDFSKIEAGKLSFETIDFNLIHTVESTVELFAEQSQRKNIEIASLIESDINPNLRGDPGRLRQVLTNLIGNAVKFTEKGEVVVRVVKESETDENCRLRFDISDTGIGIQPEAQKYLFQAFTQADGSMTRKYGGTGLGLAISKQLVELMGGEISLESEPGKGTVFSFTTNFAKQSEERLREIVLRRDLENLRVLVVDDNETNRKILAQQVTSWGMIADEADDGMSALIKLRKAAEDNLHFDLAILDLMMPSMSGFELAYFIKGDLSLSSIKLILMPSFGQRGHAQSAKENGLDGYLIKPVRQSDLYECIASLMGEVSATATETKTSAPVPFITRHVLKEKQNGKRGLILVAEDNPVNQTVARMQLEQLGFHIDVVGNGLEALQASKRRPYSLVLMDCQMPEMDGYTAATEIRRAEADQFHLPIIAMTANAMQGEREKCLAAGMDDFITKPVKIDLLNETLTFWLNPQKNSTMRNRALAEETPPVIGWNLDGESSLDNSILEGFRALQMPGTPDLVTDLIDLFIEDSTRRIASLATAVNSNDKPKIKEQAHTFKGSAGNVGAFKLAKLGKLIEENIDDADQLKLLSGKMQIELEKVIGLLKTLRIAEL